MLKTKVALSVNCNIPMLIKKNENEFYNTFFIYNL